MAKITPKPKKKLIKVAEAKKVASEVKNRASRQAAPPGKNGGSGSSTTRRRVKNKKG